MARGVLCKNQSSARRRKFLMCWAGPLHILLCSYTSSAHSSLSVTTTSWPVLDGVVFCLSWALSQILFFLRRAISWPIWLTSIWLLGPSSPPTWFRILLYPPASLDLMHLSVSLVNTGCHFSEYLSWVQLVDSTSSCTWLFLHYFSSPLALIGMFESGIGWSRSLSNWLFHWRLILIWRNISLSPFNE